MAARQWRACAVPLALLLLMAACGGRAAGDGDGPTDRVVPPVTPGPQPSGAPLSIVLLKQVPAGVRARGQQAKVAAAAAAVASTVQAAAARVLGSAADEKIKVVYKYALAGFAASLTPSEVERLKADPAVAAVYADTVVKPATFYTPDFLGLRGPEGAWSKVGGSERAGDGVIIGFVDQGIFGAHPSFAGDGYGPPPLGWRGACQDGPNGTSPICNGKIIGCKAFNAGWGGNAGISWVFGPTEPLNCGSTRIDGTITASVAAGNGIQLPPAAGGVTVSGMAPRARIASYKAGWGSVGYGLGSDIAAAIDDATRDGVHILYVGFISGPSSILQDPVGLAEMGAAAAGVFVTSPGGDYGPDYGTVQHVYPWVTTVGASADNRRLQAQVVLGTSVFTGMPSQSLTGGVWPPVGPAPVILASSAALPGVAASDAQRCFNGTLDPAKVAGTIVVCDRGVNDRGEKADNVQAAGGIGMVLLNVPGGATGTALERFAVSTVWLTAESYKAVHDYAATDGATATLPGGILTVDPKAPAPLIPAYSSRGPARAAFGYVLKPDAVAVGHLVVAASFEAGYPTYNIFAGTLISSAHVAGLAALIKQRHPTWSPMSIKSALMTTAYQTLRTGRPGEPICDYDTCTAGGPFLIGAGHVDGTVMLNPGLVLDSRASDWQKFLCSVGEASASSDCSACSTPGACDPGALNMPSLTMPFLADTYSVARTVTSTLTTDATFSTSIQDAPSGAFTITTSPATFTLAPGARQTVLITLQARTNISTVVSYGSVTWTSSGAGTSTRIPVGAAITSLSAPPEVVVRNKAQSAVSLQVTPAFDGRLVLQAAGLFASRVQTINITTGLQSRWNPASGLPPAGNPGTTVIRLRPLSSGGSRMFLRAALYASEMPAPGVFASIFVYVDGILVGASAVTGGNQVVDYAGSQGREMVIVLLGGGAFLGQLPVKLHVWQLPIPTIGNSAMTVAPSVVAASSGTASTVTVGLGASLVTANPAKRYLGILMYFREATSNYLGRFTVVSYAR